MPDIPELQGHRVNGWSASYFSTFEYYGPTYTVVRVRTMTDIMLIASMTPIAGGKLRHRFHFRMKNMAPLLNPLLLRVMAKQIEHDFMGDLPIWEHKIYREHPMLCKGEGAIMKMRGWLKQFYSPPQPSSHATPRYIDARPVEETVY